jgi:uncharacterized membrane protein YhaH (DUF805 family)
VTPSGSLNTKASDLPGGETGLFFIVGIPYLFVALPVIVKRLHDFGQSGFLAIVFLLLCLIPIVNLLAGLAMLLIPGTSGPNKYGAWGRLRVFQVQTVLNHENEDA